MLERRSYRNALSQYYGEFIERGHVLENIFGQAQGRIAALTGLALILRRLPWLRLGSARLAGGGTS